MKATFSILRIATTSLLGISLALSQPVQAQPDAKQPRVKVPKSDVQQQITRSAEVLELMKADTQLMSLLKLARGVFVVPAYARAGLGIGARGGEGVMLARQKNEWTSPLFYNVGGVSIGLQAGVEVGPIVMLLMNERALNEFRKENNIALNAEAGLTLVNYNATAQEGVGQGDVVVWTNTKGAFATAALGVVDIHFDDTDNRAYYGRAVKPGEILSGQIKETKPGILERSLQASAGN